MEKIIAVLHFVFFLFFLTYAFLFPKNWFDLYYLFLLFSTALSWTICKGECIISVLFKKYNDPNYKIGENQSVDDLTGLFGPTYKCYVELLIKPIMALQSYIVYLVLIRNHMNGYYALLYFLYIIGLTMTNAVLYQGFFFFGFLWILIKIIHKVWR